MHEELAVVFPELAHLTKWHLVSTDGPMHYIANTTYHASKGSLESARNTAVAPYARLHLLKDIAWLNARLPQLMAEFEKVMTLTFKL
jgi:hypothetical protein